MFTLKIHPAGVPRFLVKVVLVLLIADLLSIYLRFVKHYQNGLGFVPAFDFDTEYNIPSIYSTFAIFISATLLWLISFHSRKSSDFLARRWKALALIFIYLGFDELMSIHEELSRVVNFFFHDVPFFSESRLWILPYSLLLVGFFLYFIKFFLRLPRKIQIHFVLAGLMYVGGAVGMEIVSDQYAIKHGAGVMYALLSTLEETMEMLGIIMFIRILLIYIVRYMNLSNLVINLHFSEKIDN
jgi:hypothetical protein